MTTPISLLRCYIFPFISREFVTTCWNILMLLIISVSSLKQPLYLGIDVDCISHSVFDWFLFSLLFLLFLSRPLIELSIMPSVWVQLPKLVLPTPCWQKWSIYLCIYLCSFVYDGITSRYIIINWEYCNSKIHLIIHLTNQTFISYLSVCLPGWLEP